MKDKIEKSNINKIQHFQTENLQKRSKKLNNFLKIKISVNNYLRPLTEY